MRAVVGYELGGHRFESAGEEEVQQQRLDKVVGMMAQRDFRGADFLRDSVQDPAAQTRAQRTGRVVGVEDVVDQLPDASVLDSYSL
jgi:hypothetical protein